MYMNSDEWRDTTIEYILDMCNGLDVDGLETLKGNIEYKIESLKEELEDEEGED